MKKPKKIYILGHSGTGTTTLAAIISDILKIPYYDMDDVRFIKKFSKVRSVKQRKKLVDKLLKKRKWIFEGRGTDWDRHSFFEADMIIWLLTPAHKRAFRIFKRYLQRKKLEEFDENLWGIFLLMKYSMKFKYGGHDTHYKQIKKFLDDSKFKPVIIRNQKQLDALLKKLKK